MPSLSKNDGAATAPQTERLPLALTRGDPSGIGPELALKAWLALHRDACAPTFFVIAELAHLAALAERFAFDVPIESCAPQAASAIFPHALPVVALSDSAEGRDFGRVHGRLGTPDVADARPTLRSIEMAVEFVRQGHAAAIVTNPIAKDILQRAGFPHAGHTEFLGELAQRLFPDGQRSARPVMLLWSPDLAVVPATIHVPLAQVPKLVTFERLVETGKVVARDLTDRFGVPAPKLVFTGLNPHAGESGHMGREEIDIIVPALNELRRLGIDAKGPFPADTLFHATARRRYDVAVCMYHDQALIPIKTLAFESAVNVTLGLPFIRTSPDHGTAFDIACEGRADPTSLIAALRLAARLARTQRAQSRAA